jgi:metal-responsive CopG/Arc/MetJ family transcriptional regulator
MADNTRFQARDTEEELQKLDEALRKLGYKDRADWYRDMKRQTIKQSKEQS